MKLWKLYGIFSAENKKYFGWSTTHGLVVRAESEESARKLAEESRKYDGYDGVWTNSSVTTCTEIPADGPEEVILVDFNAG